jgi:hypothetical protein
LGLVVLTGMLGVGLWSLRQSVKQQNAENAQIRGMAAVEAGDWKTALDQLSLALSQNQDDLETILVFADARSRVSKPNNGHLSDALRLYMKAFDLSKSQEAGKDLQIAALMGRARMEFALSQLSRLRDTSLKLLDLDPENSGALINLQIITQSTGEYLPEDTSEVVRGNRSTAQWLDSLRLKGDESALRWVLERMAVEQDSLDCLVELIEILRKGESVERQLLAELEVEQLEDLLLALGEETPALKNAVRVFIAEQALRKNDALRARALLDEIEWSKITDGRILLFAANIREAMGTSEDLSKAEILLAAVGQFALDDPRLIGQVSIRYWNKGRLDDAIALLDGALEKNPADPQMIVSRSLFSALSEREDSQVWLEALRKLKEDAKLPAKTRERVDIAAMIIERKSVDLILESSAILSRWLHETLLLCAVGDLADEGNRPKIAISAYRLALASTEAGSNPINARLLITLWRVGSLAEAFRVAVDYAESAQSIRSIGFLCDAWIRLKSVGLQPTDVVSGFDQFQNVEELLLLLENVLKENGQNANFLHPLLVRNAIVSGEEDLARNRLDKYLKSETNPAGLMIVLGIAEQRRLEIAPEIIEEIRRLEGPEDLEDKLVVLESLGLEKNGDADAAFAVLQERFSSRDDYASRRILGFEYLRKSSLDDAMARQGFDILLRDDVPPSDLLPILKAAIEMGESDVAEGIIGRMSSVFGASDSRTTLGQALFSARFEIDNASLVLRSIGEVDAALSRDASNPELAGVLARLYLAEVNPSPTQAIDVLTESVRQSPESIDNVLVLIDQLQRLGRFETAEVFVSRMQDRRGSISQNQRAFLVKLMGRQGDLSAMQESICELAAKSGDARDLLACAQIHFNLEEFEAGDVILDELASRPKRLKIVDLAIADREIERGNREAGLEVIRSATSFDSDLDQRIELATRLMKLERWSEVLSELDPSDSEVDNSGKAQLLLAMFFLNENQRDITAVRSALDRVLELNADDANYVLQAVTIAFGDPELQGKLPGYLEKLALVDAERAGIIRLRLEFDEAMIARGSLDGFEERALVFLDLRPESYVSWSLFFLISSTEYELARGSGDLIEMMRLEVLLEKTSSKMIQRYSKSGRALSRVSKIQLLLNNPSEALLLAKDSLARAIGTPVLGQVLPVALAEFYRQNYDGVTSRLAPFVDEIVEEPLPRRESWRIMFLSLLYGGQVEESARVYGAMFAAGGVPQQWLPWIREIGALDPAVAIEACRIAEPSLSTFDLKLASAEAMASVYQRTGDPAVKEKWSRIMTQLSLFNLPYSELRLKISQVEFAAIGNELEVPEQALQLLKEIPPDLFNKLANLGQLPKGEQAMVEAAVSSVMIFYNNLIARGAEAILKGDLDPDEERRLIVGCRVASEGLAQFLPENPEVLDSRALLALALDDLNGALELNSASLAGNSGSPVYLLTKARIEFARKQFPLASQAATAARTLERAKRIPDQDLIRRSNEILEASKLNGMIELLPESRVAA